MGPRQGITVFWGAAWLRNDGTWQEEVKASESYSQAHEHELEAQTHTLPNTLETLTHT